MPVRRIVLALAVVLALAPSGAQAAAPCGTHPWCPTSLSAAACASLVVSSMTTAEKLELVGSGFAFFDSRTDAWTRAAERYHLFVGTSSRDLPLAATIG